MCAVPAAAAERAAAYAHSGGALQPTIPLVATSFSSSAAPPLNGRGDAYRHSHMAFTSSIWFS